MSDDKTNQEIKTVQPKARKTLGKEEMFDVFKAGGETEFFARPAQKKQVFETEARNGPSIHREITDALGPTIKHETRDAIGPTIDHSLMDGEGPSIKKAEISDADGPTIAHQMKDGVGPTIKKTEIVDADGPTISHQMSDGNGPLIKHVVETTRAKLPTIPNALSSTKITATNLSHQPENSPLSEPAHRMDTFSVHMAERIAKMKLEQKETKTKMDDLEAHTQEMQGKLTPKGK